MECSQKWLDVFITNADPDQESDYDDQHVTAVQSVRVYKDSSTIIASIVEEETDWVIPTLPEGVAIDPFKEICVGDLVRIGVPNTHGFTDYLTVVEKVAVKKLSSGSRAHLRNATCSKKGKALKKGTGGLHVCKRNGPKATRKR